MTAATGRGRSAATHGTRGGVGGVGGAGSVTWGGVAVTDGRGRRLTARVPSARGWEAVGSSAVARSSSTVPPSSSRWPGVPGRRRTGEVGAVQPGAVGRREVADQHARLAESAPRRGTATGAGRRGRGRHLPSGPPRGRPATGRRTCRRRARGRQRRWSGVGEGRRAVASGRRCRPRRWPDRAGRRAGTRVTAAPSTRGAVPTGCPGGTGAPLTHRSRSAPRDRGVPRAPAARSRAVACARTSTTTSTGGAVAGPPGVARTTREVQLACQAR